MAELGNHFDIQKILLEAQSRWLRPSEICEILQNHQRVGIAVEPPNKPPSGSFFLFNREVLRGFRNDGHNWKKDKKGNSMKEGHEKLKVGGSDVLHCYYAHGGENECFKRRSYSMLDQTYKHIVLVHYLEVKVNKKILGRNGVTKEVLRSSLNSNSASSRCLANRNAPSPLMHITILNSTQKSEHEAAESGEPFVPSFSFNQCATMEFIRKQKNAVPGKSLTSLTDKLNIKQEVVHRTSDQDIWQVMIIGKFLKSRQDVSEECKWSCMFGDVEVPVEVLEHGVLRCKSPPHRDGKVPFYVTCSNRLACSEVREFEFRVSQTQDSNIKDLHRGSTNDMLLHIRLGKLLSLGSLIHQMSLSSYVGEKPDISCKISSLMKEGDGEWMQTQDFSQGEVKEQLLQKLLKERMHDWLLHKVTEDSKGPCVLDEEGQGVIHLSAALGFDWAIAATTTADVNINFRDLNGWTALHWSAFYGRERTSVALVSHGASPGALTDPTPEFPRGRTPADLASANGHKGIAGYLAKCSLTTHLSFLALKDTRDSDVCATTCETTSGLVATPLCDDSEADVSLKGSLTAYTVAAQAAARIHQALRVRSFQGKMLVDYGDDKFGKLDVGALPLTSVQIRQTNVPVHTAAVKIQAHVRGHQVRKHYRTVLWSVGIVEKVILRWRRKGSGLRGFRLAADIEGTTRIAPSKDDEYDFLTEGRKQTEERLQKALMRVKSMVQYPEARDQYHRLLNVVTELQEAKVMSDKVLTVLNSSEEPGDNSDAMTIDFEPFLRDSTFMSTVKSYLLEFDDSITSSAAAMVIHDHSIPSSTLTSPKESSRRFVQKRVVSPPTCMDQSGTRGSKRGSGGA